MTKQIRIENADTSPHKVQVRVQYKAPSGEWFDTGEVFPMHSPTMMVMATIHDGRRLVVEELPAAATAA